MNSLKLDTYYILGNQSFQMKHGHVWRVIVSHCSTAPGHLQLLIALKKRKQMGNLGFSDVPCEPYKMNKCSLFLSLCVHSWEGTAMELGCLQSPVTTSLAGLGNPWSGEETYEGGREDSEMPSVKWGRSGLVPLSQASELL